MKHLKIYNAEKRKPICGRKGSPMLLVFLDEIFTWGFGYYDPKQHSFVLSPMHSGFKPLYWMLVPSRSVKELDLLASK